MKIVNAFLKVIATRISQYPTDELPEFLLVGRSNVGKSSFINTLVSRKNIARISAIPGKTQTLNFYLINELFYLVDVPGYGFAKVSKKLKNKFPYTKDIIDNYYEKNFKKFFINLWIRHSSFPL